MANTKSALLLAVTVGCVARTLATNATPDPTPMNVYFGSLGAYDAGARHSRTPREEFERARIVEGLDFLAVADAVPHSPVPAIASGLNGRLADRFVALYAWRYGNSSRGAHVSVLEPRDQDHQPAPEGRFDLFYRSWLPGQTDTTGSLPIVQFAESRDPSRDYGRSDIESLDRFLAMTTPFVRTIQITMPTPVDGPQASEAGARTYLEYLNAGFRVAPTADSGVPPRGDGQNSGTAILAPRLTKRDILESIRARRLYATDDRHTRVTFSINHHAMGTIAPIPSGTPLRIEFTFSNPNEPDASYWISLRRDTPGGEVEAADELCGTDFAGDGRVVFTQFRRSTVDEYFLAHIVQRSRGRTSHVWTAPIWLIH